MTSVDDKRKNVSKSERSGIVLPVGKIGKLVKLRHGKNMGPVAGVMCSGAAEFLVQKLVDKAGDRAEQQKRARIKPEHVQWALVNDPELQVLSTNLILPNGRIMTKILPHNLKTNLEQQKARRKAKRDAVKAAGDDGSNNDDDDNDESSDESSMQAAAAAAAAAAPKKKKKAPAKDAKSPAKAKNGDLEAKKSPPATRKRAAQADGSAAPKRSKK